MTKERGFQEMVLPAKRWVGTCEEAVEGAGLSCPERSVPLKARERCESGPSPFKGLLSSTRMMCLSPTHGKASGFDQPKVT